MVLRGGMFYPQGWTLALEEKARALDKATTAAHEILQFPLILVRASH